MSDDTKQEPVVKTEAEGFDPLSALSPEARELFEQTQASLLSALQKERDARDAEKRKADALEKAQQEAERKRLEESNQYKELYERTQIELTNLKPKAEAVDAAEKAMGEILIAQIEELPEEFRDVVPDGLSTKQKLDWLAKNKSKFMKAEPFDIGAGKSGIKNNKRAVELTQEEKETAQKMGISEEDYANNRKK